MDAHPSISGCNSGQLAGFKVLRTNDIEHGRGVIKIVYLSKFKILLIYSQVL